MSHPHPPCEGLSSLHPSPTRRGNKKIRLTLPSPLRERTGVLETAAVVHNLGRRFHVQAATANMDSITAKVKRGEGTVGALINDKKIYEQMNTATAEVRK